MLSVGVGGLAHAALCPVPVEPVAPLEPDARTKVTAPMVLSDPTDVLVTMAHGAPDVEVVMGDVNKRVVQRRSDGKTEVRQPGATRASAVVDTQSEGIARAREILARDGGGELQVRGLNGEIRQQDTIKPGNDPRSSKG